MARFVYIAEAENGVLKIGCAVDPWKRLSTIRTHSPLSVRLIAMWRGSYADEQALHAHFSDSRNHCEWFRPDGAIQAFAAEKRGLGVDRIPDWPELLHFDATRKAIGARKIGAAHRRLWADPEKRRENLIRNKTRRLYRAEAGPDAWGHDFRRALYEAAEALATTEYDAEHGASHHLAQPAAEAARVA